MSKRNALRVSICLLSICLLAASLVTAQEMPKMPAPQKEHQWLEQFVGQWTTESEGSMGEGQPKVKHTGTINARMLGGFWVVSEMKGEVMGTQINALQTIGYDTETRKYVGTWVDSMMNHMWKYEGSVDASGKILTLEADGPSFVGGGKKTRFRDLYEFKSKDEMTLTSQMQTEDGKWVTFMSGTGKRQK